MGGTANKGLRRREVACPAVRAVDAERKRATFVLQGKEPQLVLFLMAVCLAPSLAHACPAIGSDACLGNSNASVYLETGQGWLVREGVIDPVNSLAYGR